MSSEPFVSYAQNGEDVLLWRALGHVTNGRYVDVGAWHPEADSVTKAFYDRGWRGVSVEPVPQFAQELREARPGDEIIEAAVTASDVSTMTLHEIRIETDTEVTGLSTTLDSVAETHGDAGYVVEDVVVPTATLASVFEAEVLGGVVHFLKIDVEGAEADALRSMDFKRHRPWVVVVEATRPNSTDASHEEWDPLLTAADYEFAFFDGLSRYYVAAEQSQLKQALSYPPCIFDNYWTAREAHLRDQVASIAAAHSSLSDDVERMWADVVHWRNVAFESWAAAMVDQKRLETRVEETRDLWRGRVLERRAKIKELREEIERMQGSASWQVTRPLRGVRSLVGRRGSGKATDQ